MNQFDWNFFSECDFISDNYLNESSKFTKDLQNQENLTNFV